MPTSQRKLLNSKLLNANYAYHAVVQAIVNDHQGAIFQNLQENVEKMVYLTSFNVQCFTENVISGLILSRRGQTQSPH